MAKKSDSALIKVRVLVTGAYGFCNTVVELDAETLKTALASGEVDASPEAVAAALE